MAVLKSRESLAVRHRPKRLEQFIGQEEIIDLLQGQFLNPNGVNRSFLLSGATGCGKCITDDSLILTPNGFMEIKDIIDQGCNEGFTKKNILVCNKDGEFEQTSHVFYEKTKETYRITTEDYFQIEGTPEHKLLCLIDNEIQWKRLDEISCGDLVAIEYGMNLWPENTDDDLTASFSYSIGYELMQKLEVIAIPKPILQTKRCNISAFLKACFDACYSKTRLLHNSKRLLQQIQILLLNYGVYTILVPLEHSWELRVLNEDELFADVMTKYDHKPNPKLVWAVVQNVEHLEIEKFVYDVTLPDTHSFFANGFVNHNTSLARVIAHYVNCENFDKEKCSPCGVCNYCKDVDTRNYYGGVDEINFSNERGIDTIRAVIDSTAYASQYNAHIYICDEIQCLTGVAQNALLKILEEPPEDTLFLLLTTDPHKLLPTIINRCCPLTLERVDVNAIANHLLKVCKLEKRDYFTPKSLPEDPNEIREELTKAYAVFKNIAMSSNGYVRQALATLEAVLCMIEGGNKLDVSDPEVIKKIVGRFNLDTPDVEVSIAQYLIAGIYSGRYSIALANAIKLLQQNVGNIRQLFDRVTDFHLQSLYNLIDPNKKIAVLTDPYYNSWFASLLDAAKTQGGLQLTHKAAAEMVDVLMQLNSQLGMYTQDEKKLVIAATLKMLDIVLKYSHLAYTKSSLYHKVHCADMLRPLD